jgi:hypothetical protein
MLPSFQDTEPRFITMLKQSLPSHWQYERHLIDYDNSFGHVINIWVKKSPCQIMSGGKISNIYGETHCIRCDTANAGAYGFDSEALFIDCVLKEIKAIDMRASKSLITPKEMKKLKSDVSEVVNKIKYENNLLLLI